MSSRGEMTNPGFAREGKSSENEIEQEIADLERQLATAKAKRNTGSQPSELNHLTTPSPAALQLSPVPTSANHFLLLLSDSALPLGSFAFSSGLESYLAHTKAGFHGPSHPPATSPAPFAAFLPLSVSAYASTTLPFVLAAHRNPSTASLAALDDALDATIICTVGRRSSVAQGRALLSIWERSLSAALPPAAGAALQPFSALLKNPQRWDPPPVSAHLAPLFGAIGRLAGLGPEQTAYVFMLGHVKALVSAAVRAGMFGPYQAQKTLAGAGVQGLVAGMVEREWATPVEKAGQCVPVMDLWFGRHEVLYSRIFNS
ncbi:hypothetical protein B0T25DRAFT_82530 [Lasiosphaeria hispida]|uniref:Urease accessory protein UreF n=1 Tax=Lasiosphaeria hispida TaxID=260671 RepID=A0AAJ0HPD8_9PEZI|nr:hypothetical protein B0T25DRAFT_82530 [Lasiosphaeria hispida]